MSQRAADTRLNTSTDTSHDPPVLYDLPLTSIQNLELARQCLEECAKKELGVVPECDENGESSREEEQAWWYLSRLHALPFDKLALVWAKTRGWTPNYYSDETYDEVNEWIYWRLRFVRQEFYHFETRRFNNDLTVFGIRTGVKQVVAFEPCDNLN